MKKVAGVAMTKRISNLRIVTCPVCGSDGPELRHDIRSSLLYSCDKCEHEWQIDPEDEPSLTDSERSGSPPAVALAVPDEPGQGQSGLSAIRTGVKTHRPMPRPHSIG